MKHLVAIQHLHFRVMLQFCASLRHLVSSRVQLTTLVNRAANAPLTATRRNPRNIRASAS